MELTNKRQMYNVTNSSEKLTLSGEITIDNDNIITNFSGNFKINEPSELNEMNISGMFNYTNRNDKVDKQFYSIPTSLLTSCEVLLDTTILAIKLELEPLN